MDETVSATLILKRPIFLVAAIASLLVAGFGCRTAPNATHEAEERLAIRSAHEVVREMGFRSEQLSDRSFLMWVGSVSVTISATNQTLCAEVDVNTELLDTKISRNEGYQLLRVQNDTLGRRKLWLRSDMPKSNAAPSKERIRSWLSGYLRETADYLKKHRNRELSSATTGNGATETPTAAPESMVSDLKGRVVEDLLTAKGLPWERDEKIRGLVIKRSGQRNMLIVHWNFNQMNSFDFFLAAAPTTKNEILAFNRRAKHLELTPSSDGKASAHAKMQIPDGGMKESEFKRWLYGCLDDAAILAK